MTQRGEADATARASRQQAIQRSNERFHVARCSVVLVERVTRATRHYDGGFKTPSVPPRELYMKDCLGTMPLSVIDLKGLFITNEWLDLVVSDIQSAISAAQRRGVGVGRGHASSAPTSGHSPAPLPGPTTLRLAQTAITDTGFRPVHQLKHLVVLDVSRCSLLTDESLTLVRRHLGQLQELHISECRHFSSDVLCQTWRDCTRLHTLVANGCPGVTDTVLQCLATAPRAASGHTLRRLCVGNCKSVTSSGVAHLATSSSSSSSPSTGRWMHLQELSVRDCVDVDNMAFFGFDGSSSVASLRSLDLAGLLVDETSMSWIAKGCAALERLHLARCRTLTDFALALLSPLVAGRLVYLNLTACVQISDVGIQHLFAGSEQRHHEEKEEDGQNDPHTNGVALQVLNVKNCPLIGDRALAIVGSHCVRLQKLNLRGLGKVSDVGLLSIAKGCPQLCSIKLTGRYLTDQTFRALGRLLPRLQTVDLSRQRDLDSPRYLLSLTMPSLARSASWTHSGSSLTTLNASATSICDDGVRAVAANCPRLRAIHLANCLRLTNDSIEALALSCLELGTLVLTGTRNITDRALYACAMAQLPLLRVDLCGNIDITDPGLHALCTSCGTIQELNLKGCDRLSADMIRQCHALLPFTRPLSTATATTRKQPQQQLKQSSSTSTHKLSENMLRALPARHLDLLGLMVDRYESACVLQAKYRRYRDRIATVRTIVRRRLQRHARAARKMQRSVRSFLCWRRYLQFLSSPVQLWKVVLLQAYVRGTQSRARSRLHAFTLHHAAKTIQRAARPRVHAWRQHRSNCALTIQRVYRGHRGRQLSRLRHLARREVSGTVIWHWYRRCLHHREFQVRTRWLLVKIRRIQGQYRKFRRRRNLTRFLAWYRSHTIRIQAAWRACAARRYVSALRIRLTANALTLQRVYRGHVARQWTRQWRRCASTSATCIQSRWRGLCARRLYQAERQWVIRTQRLVRYALAVRHWCRVVEQASHQHHEAAARLVQRCLRGHHGRRRARLFRKIQRAVDRRNGQDAAQAMRRHAFLRRGAAVLLQRWLRRVFARRQLLRVRGWRHLMTTRCIQRYMAEWVRLARLRRRRAAQNVAAALLQRVYRGHCGRVRSHQERLEQRRWRGAVRIQRVYRRHRGRRWVVHEVHARDGAARLLQRVYRGRHSRQLYEISLAASALRAKEKHDQSLLGKWEARRNPIDVLFRRARLLREREVLLKMHGQWAANRVAQERAARKLRREGLAMWSQTQETVAHYLATQHKLFGVTENVYVSYREYEAQCAHGRAVRGEICDWYDRVTQCADALRSAVKDQRMLDGDDVWKILDAHGCVEEVMHDRKE